MSFFVFYLIMDEMSTFSKVGANKTDLSVCLVVQLALCLTVCLSFTLAVCLLSIFCSVCLLVHTLVITYSLLTLYSGCCGGLVGTPADMVNVRCGYVWLYL